MFLNTRPVPAASAERALSGHMSMESLRAALQSAAGRWRPGQRAKVEAALRSLDGVAEVPETKQHLMRATPGVDEKRRAWRAKRRAAAGP